MYAVTALAILICAAAATNCPPKKKVYTAAEVKQIQACFNTDGQEGSTLDEGLKAADYLGYTQQQIRDLFKKYDTDNNGIITYGELLRAACDLKRVVKKDCPK